MQKLKSKFGLYELIASILIFPAPMAMVGQQDAEVWANVGVAADRSHLAQTPASSAVTAAPEGLENLPLAPGALLKMDIYGAPEMSMQLRVNEHGDVAIPLVGAVQVADQTVTNAQATIAKALSDREILKEPQVALNVLQFPAHNISVLGEVQAPGRVQLLAPQSLDNVLASAGGETVAAGDDIEIEHHGETTEAVVRHIRFAPGSDASVLHGTLVAPGDTVVVHRAGIIYVLGAVTRPGGYRMVDGGALNIAQAVSLAGGETLQAAPHRAMIVRRKDGQIEQIKVPLREMEIGKLPATELQLNDVVYIPSSAWKSLVMNGSNLLSAAATSSIYAGTTHP
jgi:polysaccharide export outer membrane protein